MHLQASAAFAPGLKKPAAMNLSDGAKSINSHRKPTVHYMIQGVRISMKISELLTPEDLQTFTSSQADSPASRFPLPVSGKDLTMNEVICSLNLPESLKTKDLAILYLKMFPDCWGLTRGRLSRKSLKRFQNWGTVWNGLCITAQISECRSQGGESTLQDVLEQTAPEKYYISERAIKKLTGKLSR